jgi:hypothetical protein
MHTAKTLAEFHFDTVKSGCILRTFLSDSKISRAECAKRIGLSYDALDDSLKGRNKDSKMELVVKICFLTGRTVKEWCELMLDGVNEDVAEKVRAVFAPPAAPLPPSVDEVITRCLDVQEHSAEHYQAILRSCYDELRVSKEEMRQQYEKQVAYLQEENQRLLSALVDRR